MTMKKSTLLKWLGGALATACLSANCIAFTQTTVSVAEPAYNMDQILAPVWEGDVAYQESVLAVRGTDNQVEPIPLLYPIEEIIEVKHASLSKTYKEGVDYTVSDGLFVVLEGGDIPVLANREFHPMSNDLDIKDKNGGYICFHEGDWFHNRQIVITYRHSGKYRGYVPEGKADRLPNTLRKLQNKEEEIDLLVFGDSISVGGNASGFLDVAPYMPTYSELFAKGLEEYGVTVNVHNYSVGGQTSTWGATEIKNVLEKVDDVDLAIVAFGMNDGSLDGYTYLANTTKIWNEIQTKFTDAEALLVAPMLPNPDAVGFWKNQVEFYTVLEEYEQTVPTGIAVANVTKVHETLLQRKRYADMTGNNVNHANDYLSRVYAQTLLKTMQEYVEEETQPEESVSDLDEEPAVDNGCGSVVTSVGAVAVVTLGVTAVSVLEKKKKRK